MLVSEVCEPVMCICVFMCVCSMEHRNNLGGIVF